MPKRKNQVQFSAHIAAVLIYYEDKNRLCKTSTQLMIMRASRKSHSCFHVCCCHTRKNAVMLTVSNLNLFLNLFKNQCYQGVLNNKRKNIDNVPVN